MNSNNNADLISVIIPTYNRRDKVKKAINSVLAQTYEKFELIVVDDGSTDGTADFVRSLDDSRLQLIQFSENRGVNAARNAGIDWAKGFWVVFLDSDDLYFPDALEKYYHYGKQAPDSVGIIRFNALNSVTGEVMGRRPKDKDWSTEIVSYEGFLLAPMEGDQYISFRPQIFDNGLRFPEWINGYESLAYAQMMKDWDCLYVNEVIGEYDREKSPDRLSFNRDVQQPGPFAKAIPMYLEAHHNVLVDHPKIRAKLSSRVALCYGYLGKRWEGMKWLSRAIWCQPGRFWYPLKVALPAIVLGKSSFVLRKRIRPKVNEVEEKY